MKIKTLKTIINGNPIGSTIEVSKKDGEYLVKKGLAEVVVEPKKTTAPKKETKAPTKRKAPAKKKTETTDKK